MPIRGKTDDAVVRAIIEDARAGKLAKVIAIDHA